MAGRVWGLGRVPGYRELKLKLRRTSVFRILGSGLRASRMESVVGFRVYGFRLTHRPLSSSFLWFIFRILQGNPKN